jgi:prophage regulatory protein
MEPRHHVSIKPIFVELATAAELLTLSVSTLESLERDQNSDFPKKCLISPRRTGYLLREIEEWGESRPVSDLPPPPNTGAKKNGRGSGIAPALNTHRTCRVLASETSTSFSIYDLGIFGLPPFRPLILDCPLPASLVGPVEAPPCHLQRPLS